MTDRSFCLDGSTGRGILLLHGLTGAPAEMKMLARALHRDGFSASAPQLAGHCADLRTLRSTNWRDWLESAAAAYERLSRNADEVSVAGICVGGMLGLLLAREFPKIHAAVVYSMTFRYDGWNMKRWYASIVPIAQVVAAMPLVRNLTFAEPPPFGLKDERLRRLVVQTHNHEALIPGALARVPLGCMRQEHLLAAHLERVAPHINTPTLIIHAHEDDIAHPRNAWRLQAALGGPAAVAMIEDCYHMIHLDKQHRQVAGLTRDHCLSAAHQMKTKAREELSPNLDDLSRAARAYSHSQTIRTEAQEVKA